MRPLRMTPGGKQNPPWYYSLAGWLLLVMGGYTVFFLLRGLTG